MTDAKIPYIFSCCQRTRIHELEPDMKNTYRSEALRDDHQIKIFENEIFLLLVYNQSILKNSYFAEKITSR